MRVIVFLLFIVFVHPSCKSSSSNIELQNDKEVRKALSHRWEATYMEVRGARVKVPEEQSTSFLFDENGTVASGVKNGVIVNKSEWDYDPKIHILTMGTGKEKGPSKVLKLTGKELILLAYWSIDDKIVDSTVMTFKKS